MTQAKKILVVDDDEDLLMLVGFHLQKLGLQVIMGQDGNDAVVKARLEKPAVIMLDLKIPGRNGLEVCKELRKTDPYTYIIFLTAYNGEQERILCFEAGADDYMTKPVNPKELVARMKNILRRYDMLKLPAQPNYQAAPEPARAANSATTAPLPQSNPTPARPPNTAPLPATQSAPLDPMKTVELNTTLQAAKQAAQNQDINQARKYYLHVLRIDPTNEEALMWLAWYTNDPFEGVRYLERLVAAHPDNPRLKEFLEAGKKRVGELDTLITGSNILNYWHVVEQVQEDRIRKGVDRRTTPILPVGQLLLKKQIITQQQLETALSLHDMLNRVGTPKKLGEVLLEYGYLTKEQLNAVLGEQQAEYNSQFY
jgi:DNA-binding response OmpR family regulator